MQREFGIVRKALQKQTGHSVPCELLLLFLPTDLSEVLKKDFVPSILEY